MELWTLARKPLSEKTVAENVLKWGTGALNIDACRIELEGGEDTHRVVKVPRFSGKDYGGGKKYDPRNEDGSWEAGGHEGGRFPANLIHDGSDEVLTEFNKAGLLKSGVMHQDIEGRVGNVYGKQYPRYVETIGDSGSAARFFYCAKPSKSERDRGCEKLPIKPIPYSDYRKNVATTKSFVSEYPDGSPRPMNQGKNNHPTVKSIVLMKYLIKLITPPKGVVLDMFAGSGSTLVAAKEEGFNFIGIEKEEEYVRICEARLKAVKKQVKLF
jgi:site-specific DNA-methyltransferase (adenine-specific)